MSSINKTRYAVLGALSLGPCSGYDVKKDIEATIGHFWGESFGQIYPILRHLVAEGLAAVQPEERPGRPRRQVYAITAAGREALRHWLVEPVGPATRPRNELLLKLFFGAAIPPEITLRHLERHRQAVAATLATYHALETAIRGATDQAAEQPYWLATLRYGQLLAEATRRWCDETSATLQALAPERR